MEPQILCWFVYEYKLKTHLKVSQKQCGWWHIYLVKGLQRETRMCCQPFPFSISLAHIAQQKSTIILRHVFLCTIKISQNAIHSFWNAFKKKKNVKKRQKGGLCPVTHNNQSVKQASSCICPQWIILTHSESNELLNYCSVMTHTDEGS